MHGDDEMLDDSVDSGRRLIRELRQRLECLHRAGVRDLPRPTWVESLRTENPVLPVSRDAAVGSDDQAMKLLPDPAHNPPPRKTAAALAPASILPAISLFQEPGFETDALAPAERSTALRVLAEEVSVCRKCANLAATRTQTVFADGSSSARLMFIGEAPGADEDRTGVPFVGRAGQLLTDMITKGMGLKRQEVYIANILKCRPPENRDPTGEESANCLPYLERQIDIIRPEFICLLGRVAVQYLLGTSLSMGKLRGKWHRYKGIPTIATYHPAYLLRTPSAKKDAWEDLQLLMNAMGLAVPSRRNRQD